MNQGQHHSVHRAIQSGLFDKKETPVTCDILAGAQSRCNLFSITRLSSFEGRDMASICSGHKFN